MKKSLLRLLFAATIIVGIAGPCTSVKASTENDISTLQTQIDTLKTELNEVNSKLSQKQNTLNETKTEIDKRNKAIKDVSSSIEKTTKEEDIKNLAEELSTKIIESQTKTLLSGDTEISKLDSHPLSYSLLNNKDKSAYSVQIVNAALKQTEEELNTENTKLENNKNSQEEETNSYKAKKTELESKISSLETKVAQLKAMQEKIATIKQKYGITVSETNVDIIETALQYLGIPYVWGGTTPSGFDCSGFVQYVYARNGSYISRTTYTQIYDGKEVSSNNLQPGDLIFPHKDHVQLYIGNGMVIHAPHTGDVVKISPLGKVWKAVRVRN